MRIHIKICKNKSKEICSVSLDLIRILEDSISNKLKLSNKKKTNFSPLPNSCSWELLREYRDSLEREKPLNKWLNKNHENLLKQIKMKCSKIYLSARTWIGSWGTATILGQREAVYLYSNPKINFWFEVSQEVKAGGKSQATQTEVGHTDWGARMGRLWAAFSFWGFMAVLTCYLG